MEGQVNHQGLKSEPFLEDEMVVIVPRDHPIRERASITFQQLQDQTWITREGVQAQELLWTPCLSHIT